ncbi:hypothetical protein REPUB_Repub02eG0213800 [Reevesia pubescens]
MPKCRVRTTVVQAATVFFDTLATLDKAGRLIAGAATYGSQLVVCPEAFVGGYPRGLSFESVAVSAASAEDNKEFLKYHTSAIEVPGPEVDRLAKIAGKYKVHLVMGVVERAGFYLLVQFCFLIPWDGIEIYCAPTADAREEWRASMNMIHIAIEGRCFVLSANQFCRRKDYPLPLKCIDGDSNDDLSLDTIVCSGGSVIVSPSGTILAGTNYQGESLISADLDLEERIQAQLEFSEVGHGMGPDSLGWAANRPNPVLFPAAVKTEAPD